MAKHKKRTIKDLISRHVELNLKEYVLVTLALFIGIVLGVIVLNNVNDDIKIELQDYINNFVVDLSEANQIDKISLFKASFTNNLFFIISLIFVGSTVIGFPIIYAIVTYKGFCLSYSISAIVAVLGLKKGLLFCISALFFQNLIYIPCTLALAVSGVKLYKSIIKDKRKENIKLEILRHLIFSFLIGIVFLLGTFVEVYVSTGLLLPLIKII